FLSLGGSPPSASPPPRRTPRFSSLSPPPRLGAAAFVPANSRFPPGPCAGRRSAFPPGSAAGECTHELAPHPEGLPSRRSADSDRPHSRWTLCRSCIGSIRESRQFVHSLNSVYPDLLRRWECGFGRRSSPP